MTCIVAIKTEDKIYMGADSAATSSHDIRIRKDQKIFTKEDGTVIIGYTTSYRFGQIMQYLFNIPIWDKSEDKTLFAYMVKTFTTELKSTLKANSYDKGGEFLIAIHGELFHIHSDFQVSQESESYASCGSGENYALGFLYGSNISEYPLKVMHKALEAAQHFNSSVRGPFITKEITLESDIPF